MTVKEQQDIKLNIANQLLDNCKLGPVLSGSGIYSYPQFELITNADGMGLTAYYIRERILRRYEIELKELLETNNIPCLNVKIIYYSGNQLSIEVRYKEMPSPQYKSDTINIITELSGKNVYEYQTKVLSANTIKYKIHVDKLIDMNEIVYKDFESQLKNMKPFIDNNTLWKEIIREMYDRL